MLRTINGETKPVVNEGDVAEELRKCIDDPRYFMDKYCIIKKNENPNQQKLDFDEEDLREG